MLSQHESPGTARSRAALGLFLKLSFLLGLPLLQPRPSNLALLLLSFAFTPRVLPWVRPPDLPAGSLGKGLLKQPGSGKARCQGCPQVR